MALARSFTRAGALAALASRRVRGADRVRGPRAARNSSAHANGWQVCNETSFVLEAATGRPDGRAIVVQGWTRLRPGECRIAVGAPLARGTHYLYARTSSAHRGGRRQWGGDARLCVDPVSSVHDREPAAMRGDEPGRAPLPPRADQQARHLAHVVLRSARPTRIARARQIGPAAPAGGRRLRSARRPPRRRSAPHRPSHRAIPRRPRALRRTRAKTS